MFAPRVNIALLLTIGLVLALPASASGEPRARAPLQVSAIPAAFSPNGDGRSDQATITVSSDQPATVRIEVLDPEGTALRAWSRPVAPGAQASITWDGTAEGGGLAPDAAYRVRASGETPTDLVDSAETPLTIDTRAPTIAWRGGSPLVTSGDPVFRFRAEDASTTLRARLQIEDQIRPLAEVEAEVHPGVRRIVWKARMPGGGRLFPGTYFARLSVQDAAGNVARASLLPWRVERPMRARVWRQVPGARPRVAITIDDCHHASAWSHMLRTLRERHAGATFFCPGQQIVANPALARRTVRQGHEIGSHGWDHASLKGLPHDQITRRLHADAEALWRTAERTTAPYLRPPYGALDRSVVAAAGETGHARVVLWDVDTQDWRLPGTAAIVSRAVHGAGPGSIVLLHTLGPTAAALPAIISGLRRKGLEPVRLTDLFDAATHGARGGLRNP